MSTEKVTVACKLPNGHILHLFPGQPNERAVKLNGANTSRIVGGFGLTQVDKDFWDAWLKQNGTLDFVTAGMVFSVKSEREAEAESKNRENEASGFERIDPAKAPAGVSTYAA